MTISKNYAAFAKSAEGGWTAHYGAPGDEIKSISDDNGQDMIFGSKDEAEDQAAVRLVEILQDRWDRMRKFRPDRNQRVTGGQLLALIEQAELTVRDFALLSRVRGDHLAEILSGQRPHAPPTLAMLAEIFARSDEAVETANDIHDEAQ